MLTDVVYSWKVLGYTELNLGGCRFGSKLATLFLSKEINNRKDVIKKVFYILY